ncbi:MAG: helix-turn-helix domain-containing protein [Oscillospiraceae bacterium]
MYGNDTNLCRREAAEWMIIMTSFGKRLRELRISGGYTQQQLADILEISPSTIGMYEQERREPDRETLIKISSFFCVTLDFLLGAEETGPFDLTEFLADMRTQMRSSDGLMFNGVPLSEGDMDKLYESMLITANIMFNDKLKEKNDGK